MGQLAAGIFHHLCQVYPVVLHHCSIHLTHLISTHGQCVPSRASFLTGLYPHECGVMVNYGFHGHQNRLSLRQRTLGHVFSDAGYETAYFGKCHFGIPLKGMGFEHAFDYDARKIDDE